MKGATGLAILLLAAAVVGTVASQAALDTAGLLVASVAKSAKEGTQQGLPSKTVAVIREYVKVIKNNRAMLQLHRANVEAQSGALALQNDALERARTTGAYLPDPQREEIRLRLPEDLRQMAIKLDAQEQLMKTSDKTFVCLLFVGLMNDPVGATQLAEIGKELGLPEVTHEYCARIDQEQRKAELPPPPSPSHPPVKGKTGQVTSTSAQAR